MIAFYNGSYKPENEITISPFSAGFQYGCGVFTTLKYKNDKIYFFNEHLQRVITSAKKIGLSKPDYKIKKILEKLIKINNLNAYKIKIMLFAEKGTSLLIKLSSLHLNQKPMTLQSKKINLEPGLIRNHKTFNYLTNFRYLQLAEKSDYTNFLFVNNKNLLLETPIHNIFLLKNQTFYTPVKTLPILPGIIRNNLLAMKKYANFTFQEAKISVTNLSEYKAAFATNSIVGIKPIEKIDNYCFETSNVNLIRKNLEI